MQLRFLVASLFLTSSCLAESTTKSALRSSAEAECTSDKDCLSDSQFCAGGLCQESGYCRDLADCLNPSNEYITIGCAGYVDCVDNQCTQVCSDDVCPNGQPSVRCMASPCSVSTCISPIASCVDYYCGGCNALFFNPTGDLSCGSVDNNGGDELSSEDWGLPEETMCKSDSDCGDDQYCGQGECRDFGTCASDLDCFNPSNIYSTILCVGPLQCLEGSCGRICGAECPGNGGEPVPCGEELTCETASCDDVPDARCVQNDCDGCSPMFLDAAGRRVCDSEDESANLCKSDSDCGDEQFCGQGECRDFGACASDLDCFNPSNIYSTIFCVGPLQCLEGSCGRICGAECPGNGGEPVPCGEEVTCETASCDDVPDARCVQNDCDGCSPMFLDAAGRRVCDSEDESTGVSPQNTCMSDDDCDDQYCAGGVCQDFGYCRALEDCLNPSNVYNVILCVGYVECVNNQCGIQCSSDVCPDDQPLAECQAPPCTYSTCNGPIGSCVDYYCGGCHALFFNPMGDLGCGSVVKPALPGTEELESTEGENVPCKKHGRHNEPPISGKGKKGGKRQRKAAADYLLFEEEDRSLRGRDHRC